MTHIAAIQPLSEAEANHLADAIAAREALAALPVAASETKPGQWDFAVYFDGAPDKSLLADLDAVVRESGIEGSWQVSPLPDADWVAISQAALPPVRVGRVLVYGSHDRAARRGNDIGIEIEAGQAFGTGHHGTTAGCLAALNALARTHRFRHILDLGAGSGVLAIAAARLWHAPVLATDIDPRAATIAAENAHANGVGPLVTSIAAAGFRHLAFAHRGPFDLIIANILAKPLVDLATELTRHLAPGGTVVLSGLLPEQERMILATYCNHALRLGRAEIRDGWLILTLHSRRRLKRPRARTRRDHVSELR